MILPATIRDGSYIGSRLRKEDFDELACQTPAGYTPYDLCVEMAGGPGGYISYTKDGVPACLFGTTAIACNGVVCWSVSTDRVREVLGQTTRFIRGPLTRSLRRDGFTWGEARSMQANTGGERWLRLLGAEPVAILPEYGRFGETFVLHRWVYGHAI